MANYLITGVAGFIGCNIARELLRRGEYVRGIDNFSSGYEENIADLKSLDFEEADLLDQAAMSSACRGIDYVIHQAALASVPRSVQFPRPGHDSNITGTFNLLMSARDAKVKRFIYASSSSVYGENPSVKKHEGMLPDPISPYAVQKLAGEYYLSCFHRVYRLETVSLRYFNVFGPFQNANSPYTGVLARFCSMMLSDEPPTIDGDGQQSRDFTYIDNNVNANLLACSAPAEKVVGKVFNIATEGAVSINKVVAVLKDLTGYTGPVVHGPERAGDIKHSLADITRARDSLDYRPSVTFEEGLKRTVAWYRSLAAATAKA